MPETTTRIGLRDRKTNEVQIFEIAMRLDYEMALKIAARDLPGAKLIMVRVK